MANVNFNPNARYDTGQAAAGTGRSTSPAATLTMVEAGTNAGVRSDGVVAGSELRSGFNAAGVPRNNPGPNVAGAPRSVNNT